MLIGVVAWSPGTSCRQGGGDDAIGPILSLVTFLPLVGRALHPASSAARTRPWRQERPLVALWTSLVTFVLSLILWVSFDRSTAELPVRRARTWMPGFGIDYHMGVDGISVMFVLLSTLLTPICILGELGRGPDRVKEYMIAFLVWRR
jgi:NADH-quinone oxidoreductase subunit M